MEHGDLLNHPLEWIKLGRSRFSLLQFLWKDLRNVFTRLWKLNKPLPFPYKYFVFVILNEFFRSLLKLQMLWSLTKPRSTTGTKAQACPQLERSVVLCVPNQASWKGLFCKCGKMHLKLITLTILKHTAR